MRVKRGVAAHKKHKKVLKATKGFRGRQGRTFKSAKEALMQAGQHAYVDRRKKKTIFRQLWIQRINAACRKYDVSYKDFIHALEQSKIEINRKYLSELASLHPEVFKEVLDKAMS